MRSRAKDGPVQLNSVTEKDKEKQEDAEEG